jgi:hypothetical protein
MSKVVYRGVEYDTEKRPTQQKHENKTFTEVWRGVKYEKNVEVVS